MKSLLERQSSLRDHKLIKSVDTKQEIQDAFDETQNRYSRYIEPKTPRRTKRAQAANDKEKKYICGCGFNTKSMKGFRDHVINYHEGKYLQNSSHYISQTINMVFKFQSFQALIEEKTKPKVQSQFKAQNLKYKCFILVYNPEFKFKWLHCGKCESMFSKIVDFVYHCIGHCQKLQHPKSSHFIYDQAGWEKEQQLRQVINVKKNTLQHSYKSTCIQQIEEYDKQNVTKILLRHKNSIDNFTRRIIQNWRNKNIEINLNYNVNYKLINDYANIPQKFQRTMYCQTRLHYYKSFGRYFADFNEQCLKFNDKSHFLIFSKAIFYQMFKQRLANQINSQKIIRTNIDTTFIFHLIDNQEHDCLKRNYQKQYNKFNKWLKIINYDYIFSFQKCYCCGAHLDFNSFVNKQINNHLLKSQQCRKQYAFISITYSFGYKQLQKNHVITAKKKILLSKHFKQLEKYSFNCFKCRDYSQMNLSQFIDHVNQIHEGFLMFGFCLTQ